MKTFIDECSEKGIQISLNDEMNIIYRTTNGPIDRDTIQFIRVNKSEIVEYLKKEKDQKAVGKYQEFDLTDIQSAYLSGRDMHYELGGTGCYTYLVLKTKPLDPQKFEEAWHKTIQKHDMLHAKITRDNKQRILKDYQLPKLQVFKGADEDKLRNDLKVFNFNIEDEMLHKFVLNQQQDASFVHFAVDMLIADYISIQIILEDLFAFYEGENNTTIPEMAFSEVVEQKKNKSYSEKSKTYWMNKIEQNMFSKLMLPTLSEIKNQNVRFDRYKMMLSQTDFGCLRARAKENGITVSNAILSAYAAVLDRFSTGDRVCINVTLMQREKKHMNIVGDFTSVNLLTVDYSEPTFLDFAKKVGTTLLMDMSHMDYSGVEVLRQIHSHSHENTIFPVVYTSTVGEKQENKQSSYEVVDGISRTPQVWIDCQVLEQGDELEIHWDVRDGVFEKSVIKDIFETFELTIRGLVAESDWHKEDVVRFRENYFSKREEFNNVTRPYGDHMIYEGFLNSLKKDPTKTAIIYDGREYTYEELARHINAIQKLLKAKGIKKFDYVAIAQERGLLQVASVFAVVLLGATFVPIDIKQPFDRQKRIIDLSDSTFVLQKTKSLDMADAFRDKVIDLESISVTEDSNIIVDEVPADSIAYIIFTSGTTGVPKGVMISHKAAQNTLIDINERYRVCSKDVFIALTKLSFDLSIYDLFGSMDAGATLAIPTESNATNPTYWASMVEKYHVSIWNSVPAIAKMLFNEIDENNFETLKSLRLMLLSGDVIDKMLPVNASKRMTDYQLISLGGATEGSVWSIYYDITNYSMDGLLPYGMPLTNQKMYVLDNNNRPCPDLVKGEICIGGDGVARGYYKDENLTSNKYIVLENLKDRIFKTGDVGYYRPDGVLMINGRKDNQIKINGNRVEIGEIESVIRKTDQVGDCVIYYHKGEKSNKLFAFLEPKKVSGDENKDLINSNIQEIYANASRELDDLDRDVFMKWRLFSDKASLSDMLALFRKVGIFTEAGEVYTRSQIHAATKETAEFNSIVDRFLRALEEAKVIYSDAAGYKLGEKAEEYFNQEDIWDEFMAIGDEMDYGHLLMEYQRESGRKIIEQIRGEITGISLFFPQGDTDVAEAAYRENIINRRLNNIVSNIINDISTDETKLLEVGAGVGGTTTTVLKRLKNNKIGYCFTDVSQFFLNKAKDRYSSYNNLSYKLMDINKNYSEQGFENQTYDIILCANVLHNSTNIGENLSKLKKLLKPEGYLIIIEATKESYLLTTSLELKGGLNGFTDHRANGIDVFTSEEKWISLLKEAGFDYRFTLPDRNDALSECGQSVLLCRNTGSEKKSQKIDVESIEKTMAAKLPKYMIPDQIEILNEIPLTANGKIDRKALEEICKKRLDVEHTKESNEDFSDLEKQIANVWKSVLCIDSVSRKDNFYYVGGDSLLITQVVSKLRETVKELEEKQWDELMQMALNNPTIESFARELKESCNIKENKEEAAAVEKEDSLKDPAVLVYRDNPSKRKMVQAYMHAGTGRLVDYQLLIPDLLEKTDDSVSVLGFMYGNSKEYLETDEKELITKRAEKYAHILMDMKAESYEIIGYCVGGFLALETARVLLENGVDVKNVIMIGSELATHKISNELISEMAYGVAVGLDMHKAGYVFDIEKMKGAMNYILKGEHRNIKNSELIRLSGEYEEIGDFFTELLDLTHEERLHKIYSLAGGEMFNGDDSTFAMFKMLYQIFDHTFKGMMEYPFDEPYLGNVIYLDAPTDFSFYPETRPETKIEDVCIGNFVKKRVGGNHATCLMEENYRQVLGEILKTID